MEIDEKKIIISECLQNAVLISKTEKFLTTYECWKLAIQLQNVIQNKILTDTLLFVNQDKTV